MAVFPLFFSLSTCLSPASAQPSANDGFSEYRVFGPGDDNSFWRIPAILCLDDGTLIIACDRRKNDEGDLPHDIDVVVCRSGDNGRTWSSPLTVACGEGYGRGYGDAALVQCENDDILCTFAGAGGFWNSTAENPIRTYMCRSRDRGLTWTAPSDITDQLWGDRAMREECREYRGSFNASGNGLLLRNGKNKGRVMFVAAMCHKDVWRADNYAVYTDDCGISWHLSGVAYMGGDEAKTVQLPDGRLLMSIRQNGARGFAWSSDGGDSWHAQGRWDDMKTNACNGDMLLLDTFDNKAGMLLHSLPSSVEREDVSVFVSYDGGTTWPQRAVLVEGPSAYSSMTRLADGTIAVFVEKLVDGKTELWFQNFTLDWLKSALH